MTSSNAKAIPVVFIPALLCDGALYEGVIAELGDSIEAHVMMSPKPDMADSVTAILANAPDTFVLVGTSYGGNLALRVALAAPERVSALWLMGCDPAGPQPGGPNLAGGLETTPEGVFDLLAGLVVKPTHTRAAATFKLMAKRVGAASGAAQARAIASREDVTGRLATLTMPALVLWGEDDALVPVAVGQKLTNALPCARFEVLPDCGHLPTLENPSESVALFQSFLDGR